MSGDGSPVLQLPSAANLRIGIVAAQWHTEVMDGLLAGARRATREASVTRLCELRVPGTFELPVASARMAAAGYHAVVALGVVVRGGTPHFDYVCEAATYGLTKVSVETGVPIGFGVLTCDDDEQARDRAGLPGSRHDKGYEAAAAAITTAASLLEIH